MTRIEKEKQTVQAMICLYCKGNKHGREDVSTSAETRNASDANRTPSVNPSLCPQCQSLLEYSLSRLERCPFGNAKPSCARCHVHCYKPNMRKQIRNVMRYSGPRMLFYNPVLALCHLWDFLLSRFHK